VGGIEVDLSNAEQVRDGYDRIMSRSRQHSEDAEIWGALVQEMVGAGKEVIVGMNRDPQFGPLIMFGLGGIYVEVLEDVTFRLAPVTEEEAREMIDEIEASPLLRGARGEKAVDLDAIVEIVQRASQLAMDFPEIKALDLNPVVVQPDGALAIDARLSIERDPEC
jgi:acyl-CoA synthetase (NDP forming)